MIVMKGLIVLMLTFVILSDCACGVQTPEDVDAKIQAFQKLRQIDRLCGELPKPYSFLQINKGLSGNARSSIVYYQFVSDQSFGDVRQFYNESALDAGYAVTAGDSTNNDSFISEPRLEREGVEIVIENLRPQAYTTLIGSKGELLADLELARSLRLNAVVFQVRPMADAVYRPGLKPWSEFLTGEMGKPQDFDPLDFLVTEAHKPGILIHAWFNPYRAYHPAAKTLSGLHVSKQHPELFVRQYGRFLWLDPTDDKVKQYSLNVILDVVQRYDIDGVHSDDYFYPYAERDASGQKIEFPDDANWKKYKEQIGSANKKAGKAGELMDRGDWRRWHVNSFIQAIGREIKRVKPGIVYGISPFGIWQPVPEKGIEGFNAAAELYADSRKWLQDGTVDYLSPQLYWETARAGLSFPVLLDWWEAQNVRHRYVWPGIASYRVGSTKTFTAAEIASQVEATRKSPDSRGAIHFSLRSLRNDMGGIQAVLRDKVYTRDAIVPQFSWIKVEKIIPPKVSVTRDAQFVRANWTEQGKRLAFWFVVYAPDRNGWTYSVLPASVTSIALSVDRKIEEIVVTSVDRLGNESQNGR